MGLLRSVGEMILEGFEKDCYNAQKKDVFNDEQKEYYRNLENACRTAKEFVHNVGNDDY